MNKLISFSILCFLLQITAFSQQIAFPGAEGFGRYTTGGRGGDVYYVTNLNDSGEGSLRWAIQQSGPRTVVFKVSGTIELESTLKIDNDDITIAGQTAPGDGICIRNYQLDISANNVIIRFIRARLGDKYDVEADALGGRYQSDIIIDHCSMSWSVDETVSLYSNKNTTVQWCLVSESLRYSAHAKGAHGYGGIWGGQYSTFHHNLMAHHGSRVPRLGPGLQTQGDEWVDIRNNVFYNYMGEGCYGGEAMNVNIVNNYYKPGPASNTGSKRGRIIAIDKKIGLSSGDGFYPINDKWGTFYIEGNYVDASTSSGSDATVCENATNDNWEYGVYNQIHSKYSITQAEKDTLKLSTPFDFGVIETQTPQEAYASVLEHVGCSYARDVIDTRIINETKNGTATYSGSVSKIAGIVDTPSDVEGFITYESTTAPTDSDDDGMPDDWETERGLNPNSADDRNDYTLDNGYTNLEVYLNWIVRDIIGDNSNISVIVTAPENNATYVAPATIPLSAEVSVESGSVKKVDFYVNDERIVEKYMAPYNWETDALDAGTYTIKAIAYDEDNNTAETSITITVNVPQAPYGGTAHAIPGIIQAEAFDEGGNGFAYFDDSPGSETDQTFRADEDVDIADCEDEGGGHCLAYVTEGEWLEYTVNVSKTGAYDINLRVANNGDPKTISLAMDGTDIVTDISIPNTEGWGIWETVTINDIQLTEGKQVLRFTMGDVKYVNLNYIEFELKEVPMTIPLQAGWNLIGCPLKENTPVETALSSIWDKVELIKNFDGFFQESNAPFNSLTELEYAKGYLIKVSEDCELTW